MRECGLKLSLDVIPHCVLVTPHAGVWIETGVHHSSLHRLHVTPHAGVWIETAALKLSAARSTSLPMRECGLKHGPGAFSILLKSVTPHAGVWIETCLYKSRAVCVGSLPMRECGLKP